MKSKLFLLAALPLVSGYTGFSLGPNVGSVLSFAVTGSTPKTKELPVDQDLTPLMVAVRDQEIRVVEDLLTKNPMLAAHDEEGWTALTYAALNQDTSIIKALIAEGADLNARDNLGMTPLIHTASAGNNAVAQVLLSSGADVNALDNHGQTALTFAQHRKSSELIKTLRAAGGSTPLQDIIYTDEPRPDDPPNFTRPFILNHPRPNYTERARHDKVQGIVRIRILIGKNGSVQKMRAITGLPGGLTRQAYKAASQMQFIPATKDTQPVDFWQAFEVEFNVR
jgi:TonB family protein